MKQKDIVLIVIVVVISGVFSFVLSRFLFASPKTHNTEVEVVQAISSDFQQPDTRYFNANSVDPTQAISIGDNQNPQPFTGTSGR